VDDILSQREIDALMAGLDSDMEVPARGEQMANARLEITQEQIEQAVMEFRLELNRRLKQKGYGTFASTHEIAGVVDEEHREMMEALHKNDKTHFKAELLDVAVGAVFGVACVNAGTLDW
jgi:flagellar motor switch protein FliM